MLLAVVEVAVGISFLIGVAVNNKNMRGAFAPLFFLVKYGM